MARILEGVPPLSLLLLSVGNVFAESNCKRSCDFVGDNLVAERSLVERYWLFEFD